MNTLLEKTRNINKLLQKSAGNPVDFEEMALILRDQINANCYIISRQGKVLGHAVLDDSSCEIMSGLIQDDGAFPEEYNDELLRITETKANYNQSDDSCFVDTEETCIYGSKLDTVVPVIGGGQRLGTLFVTKVNSKFTDEDLILTEYGAAVVAMEILRSKADKIEEEARKRASVHIALGTLSYSELEAVEHIFGELEGDEGVLVASKIADRAGITRSVIVNALRKFESAGVIESKSLGMKGTYIRVLNENLLDELRNLKRR